MLKKNQDNQITLTKETREMFELLAELPKKLKRLERYLIFKNNAK